MEVFLFAHPRFASCDSSGQQAAMEIPHSDLGEYGAVAEKLIKIIEPLTLL
jgi:hypothetical protein